MQKLLSTLLSLLLACTLAACAGAPTGAGDDGRVHVTILHFNDIYEIAPTGDGKEGGLARVATLRRQLLARNPNTITTLGGDLFSPSALGTAPFEGDRLAGRQMVDVLNHLGVDYATFGNHEFDLKENQFHQRMGESKFTWVSSNVADAGGLPFAGVRPNVVLPFVDARTGRAFRIGLFGVTEALNHASYVRYADPLQVAGEQVRQLDGQADFIIALTHQALDKDVELLERLPRIGLLLGGHEHENFQFWRGRFSPLLKADANVRSVYVVDLYFDPKSRRTEVRPSLVPIDDRLSEDSALKAVVERWMGVALESFRAQGFALHDQVAVTAEPLDGLEAHVRRGSTALTELIARSMLRPYPQAELSLFNSGSVRIDDVLPPGPVTVYDVIRVLPFGGKVQLATIKGSLLQRVLEQGEANVGGGGFLLGAHVRKVGGQWQVGGAPIDAGRSYRLAINDFLASGKEQNLDWLQPGPDFSIDDAGEAHDVRQLVIDELKGR